MPRIPFDPLVRNEQAWDHWLELCTGHFQDMEPEDFMIFNASDTLYLQFARTIMPGFDREVLWAETAGSIADGGIADLTPKQQEEILALGWSPPDALSEFPNYQLVWSPVGTSWITSADAKDAALAAMKTLRGPLGVLSTSELDITMSSFNQ